MNTTTGMEFNYQTYMNKNVPTPAEIHRGPEARRKRREVAKARISQNDQLSRILKIICEIAEKSANDDYIYRGEPEYHEKVSSALMDFTTDYNIALFFACDDSHNKDGRVILKKIESIKEQLMRPRNPRNRVIARKSVCVRPLQGSLEPDSIVTIPKNLKQPMLEYLRKCHGISAETIR